MVERSMGYLVHTYYASNMYEAKMNRYPLSTGELDQQDLGYAEKETAAMWDIEIVPGKNFLIKAISNEKLPLGKGITITYHATADSFTSTGIPQKILKQVEFEHREYEHLRILRK